MKTLFLPILFFLPFFLCAGEGTPHIENAEKEQEKNKEEKAFSFSGMWNDTCTFFTESAAKTGLFCSQAKDSMKRQYRVLVMPQGQRILEEQQILRKARICAAGDYVAEKFPGKRVVPLIPVFPGVDMSDDFELFQEHAKGTWIANPVYVVPGEKSQPVPGEIAGVEQLNTALLTCLERRADVILIFAPLPTTASCKKLVFWTWKKDDPRIVLANVTEPLTVPRKAIPCPVSAVIFQNLLKRAEQEKPVFADDDPAEVFAWRLLLVTEENADKLTEDKVIQLIR